MNADIEKKNRTRRRVVDGLSFMRPTKVLGEDRASASEPEGHSEKATSLPGTFNCRIIPIGEDSSDKIVEQLFEGLEAKRGGLIAKDEVGDA